MLLAMRATAGCPPATVATWVMVAGPPWMPRIGTSPKRGIHGGPATVTQVATVAGEHPALARIAGSIAGRRPRAENWAVTAAVLLGLLLPGATGQSLLGE